MPVLTHADLLPSLLLIFFTLAGALLLKRSIGSSRAYARGKAEGTLWLALPALCLSLLGVPEVLALGAAGALWGWWPTAAFVTGLVPMWLLGALMAAPARRRYGWQAALLLVLLYMAGVAVALALFARTVAGVHILDAVVRGSGWTLGSIHPALVMLCAVVSLLTLLWGGVRGTARGRVLQFIFLLLGLLPLSFAACDAVGGWGGVARAAQIASPSGWMAQPAVLLLAGALVGLMVGFADLRPHQVLQSCASPAPRPLLAVLLGLPLLGLALLLIVPGAVAPQLPKPQNAVVEQNVEGVILRTTTFARSEEEQGQGLVPAVVDLQSGAVQAGSLAYTQGAAKVALKLLHGPALGLMMAAFLAFLLGGMAAQLSAVAALCEQELLPLWPPYGAQSEEGRLRLLRWTSVAAMVPSVALALWLGRHGVQSNLLVSGYLALFCAVQLLLGLLLRLQGKPTAVRAHKTARGGKRG